MRASVPEILVQRTGSTVAQSPPHQHLVSGVIYHSSVGGTVLSTVFISGVFSSGDRGVLCLTFIYCMPW